MNEELRARVLEIETALKTFAPGMQQRANALTVDAANKYAPAFDRIAALLTLSMWLVEKKAFDQAPFAVKVLLARIIESLGATQVLLKCGFPATGAVAVRSLFEATANLHLVLANKKQVAVRAKLFENYIKVKRHFRLEKSQAISKKAKSENLRNYLAVKSDYHELGHTWYWKVVKSKKTGAGREANIRELYKYARMLGRYKKLYPGLSDASHPSAAFQMWVRDSSGDMIVSLLYTQQINWLEGIAVPLAAEAIQKVLRYMKHPDTKALDFLLAAVCTAGKPPREPQAS